MKHRAPRRRNREGTVLGASAAMAAGTVVSRLSGFVRNAMLVAAIGTELHADVFNIANTVPNMLYILLAGGVFNAVLVPQLVRAMKNDADGGEAYTNRIITLAGLFLAGAAAVLVVAAPLLMRLLLDPIYFTADCAGARDAAITFARYCLPQIFFYGMFVLVGQVLNARGRFGPMMWAPIANNAIAVIVLGIYLSVYADPIPGLGAGGYTGGQELLLGLGSTLGIVVQFLILIPYLRAAGFRFRPRFDFRHTGLGHTLRLGTWTALFVVVNQIAYTVVVRVASSGTADTIEGCSHVQDAGGYTIYSFAYLLIMVPHGVITVSLATATLPRLSARAAEGNLTALGHDLMSTMRTAYAAIIPVMALIGLVAGDVVNLVYNYGRASATYKNFIPVLELFAIGAVVFTAHYLLLRGFYALEQTRRVFFNQCWVAATNIVLAIALTRDASSWAVAERLVIAFTLAYAVGVLLSVVQLRRQIPLEGRRTVRFLVRIVVATILATAFALVVKVGVEGVLGDTSSHVQAVLRLGIVGVADVLALLVLGRLMRIAEINDVTSMVTRRLRR